MAAIDVSKLEQSLGTDGFSFVPAPSMGRVLETFGDLADWPAFAASWNNLALDTHMGDGGRYRRRRFAVFQASKAGGIERQPHQPHYQGLNFNKLNGGVDRWFEPMTATVGSSASLATILRFCHSTFGALAPKVDTWHVEIHQFRIEARSGTEGRPTPEGMHRDGVNYVLVLLVDRANIKSGTTIIADLEKRELGSFTLTNAMDAAIVDDSRVYHGVTPVEPMDPTREAHRDVLVVTFRKTA